MGSYPSCGCPFCVWGMMLRIKNWERFQHFKDRRPPWIKLYRELLDDMEWHTLDAQASKLLIMLWLLAAEQAGTLPGLDEIAFRVRMPVGTVKSAIESKLSHWLIQDDINTISTCHQVGPSETETERETETEAEARIVVISPRAASPVVTPKRGKRAIADTDGPTEKHRAFALQLGLDIGPQWGKFKNYCRANDRRYADFEAAFRNWLATSAERKGERRGVL